jgi:hypothetical protein
MKKQTIGVAVYTTMVVGVLIGWAVGQDQPQKKDVPAKFKMTTEIPPGIVSPDKVETRFGTLKFFDGFPDEASVEKLYDNLDFQRAVQAYLLALPAVNQAANRNPIRKLGPINATVPIFEQLVDSRSIFLTANDNTAYSWIWVDIRKGPLVVEVPPKVLGTINVKWTPKTGPAYKL